MALGWLILGLCFAADQSVLAEIDGTPITTKQLQLELALQGATGDVSEQVRAAAIETLIERALVERFLARRKTEASDERLAIAVAAAKEALAANGVDGIDEQLLSKHLALPLAWRQYVRRVVTDRQIRDYYANHTRELDGTRLRVSQIFLKYSEGEDQNAAPETTERLTTIQESISSKPSTFAEAAQAHSEAPTAKSSGDVGWIGPQGGLPADVTSAAYKLDVGEVSDVILTPFGAHLVTVTEIDPGNLSLEDARPTIIAELSRKLWNETVAQERAMAEIHISGRESGETGDRGSRETSGG